MEYKVFARKYRPQKFADLIGQKYLVQVLQNAIKSKKIAHSFLLTGIRGIGKTTTARIIAMTLNCTGEQENETEPQLDPCLKCANCTSIVAGSHPDVIEMDGASHTGIDNIRELIQNASYVPSLARYKIFIIDEVHMLSNSAFNALLKTLEEPAAHIKFIFATTEIRKIPLTILSRCQKFELKRLTNEMLKKHLKNICAKEEIAFEENSLDVLCNYAGGSVRDALSLLDQVRLVTNDNLTEENVRNNLGYGNLNQILELFKKLSIGDIQESLLMMEDIYNSGAEAKNILNDLLEITYLISKANILQDKFVETKLSSETEDSIKKLSEKLSIASLSSIWQMLLKAIEEINKSFNQFYALEMIIIRIAHLAPQSNLSKMIDQLESKQIEQSKQEIVREGKVENLVEKENIVAKEPACLAKPSNFLEFVEIFKTNEPIIYNLLKNNLVATNFSQNSLELLEKITIPDHFKKLLQEKTKKFLGDDFALIIKKTNDQNIATIADKETGIEKNLLAELEQSEDFAKIKEELPKAEIKLA